jgi:hypothetical protein
VTNHAEGPPARRHWGKMYLDQLAIPLIPRGAPHDHNALTAAEFKLLAAINAMTFNGENPCYETNLELAKAIGLGGTEGSQKRRMRFLLNGGNRPKWDPETRRFDGEIEFVPGLCDVSRGFLVVVQESPRALKLMPRFLNPGGPPDLDDGNASPGEPSPGDGNRHAPAGPEVPTQARPFDGPEDTPGAPALQPSGGIQPVPDPATAEGTTDARGPDSADAGRPSDEALEEILGRHAASPDRARQAEQFRSYMKSRTGRFKVNDGGRVVLVPNPAFPGPLTENQEAVRRWLEPEIAATLGAEEDKARPAPKAGAPPGHGKPAPPVARNDQADIRAAIGALSSSDDGDRQRLAQRLADALGDADKEASRETYLGIALSTARGELAPAVMIEAFEAACRTGVENRGAMFVSVVKRKVAEGRRSDHVGGRAP